MFQQNSGLSPDRFLILLYSSSAHPAQLDARSKPS